MKSDAASIVRQLAGFPRAIVLVEKRGSADSDLVGAAIEENEKHLPGTYIGIVQQDAPEVVEALGVTEFPTVIIFENGREKARAGLDELLVEQPAPS